MADQVPDFIDFDLANTNRIKAAWLNALNSLRYGRGDVLRGAALLEYMPSWVAAVARSVADKLGEFLSVIDFAASRTGLIDARAAISAAVVAAAGRTLHFPFGTYKVSSNLTLSGCALSFERGAIIKPDAGVTVTINASVIAGVYQIFNIMNVGSTVTGAIRARERYPEWWGAAPDGVTDSGLAIQAANTAAGLAINGVVYFSERTAGNGYMVGASGAFTLLQAFSGVGNGLLTLDATTPTLVGVRSGVYKVTLITEAANGGTFEVKDPDNVVLGTVAVGATFSNEVKFVVADGATDFEEDDEFLITVIQHALKKVGPTRWVGANKAGVFICGTGLEVGDCVFHADGTVFPPFQGGEVNNITFMTDDGIGDLICLTDISQYSFTEVNLRDGRHGVIFRGTSIYSLAFNNLNCTVPLSGTGLLFSNSRGGQYTFTGGSISAETGVGTSGASLYLAALKFNNTNFESCGAWGSIQGALIRNLIFASGRVEDCGVLDIRPGATEAIYNLKIEDVEIDGSSLAPPDYAISLGGGGGIVRGFRIDNNSGQDYALALVRSNGDGESGSCSFNFVSNIPAAITGIRSGVLAINNENTAGKLTPTWNPPLTTPDYTFTNVTTDRTMDADATTDDERSDLIGTVGIDLIGVGIFK